MVFKRIVTLPLCAVDHLAMETAQYKSAIYYYYYYQAQSAHPNRNLFKFPRWDFSSDLAKALSAAGVHTYKYNDV